MNSEQENVFDIRKQDPFANGQVFDQDAVTYDPEQDFHKQLYWLQKYIVQAFRKAGYTNSAAKDYSSRFGRDILERARAKTAPVVTEAVAA
jgi:hypothetical protein